MPDRDWPPVQRHAARWLRAAMYAAGAVAGGATVLDAPHSIEDLPAWVSAAIGGTALVTGVVAAIASVAHRWQVEWVCAWLIAGPFLSYAALAMQADDPASTALVAGLAAAYLARAVDLWVFSLRARSARVRRVRLWARIREGHGL